MKLLSFGEVLWDVFPDSKSLGGAPMNFAAHFAKHGHEAFLLSAVGDDALGVDTRENVKALGIDDTLLSVVADKPTGVCLVTLDANGIPSYDLKQDVAWDAIRCDNVSDADILYFGTLALRSEYNRETLTILLQQNRFREVFVDVNIRPPFFSADTITFALSHATIVKISDEELPTVTQALGLDNEKPLAVAKAITERFADIHLVIITRGENGAVVYDAAVNTLCGANAVKAEVVSTVGAGDSFSASFLAAFVSGHAVSDCLSHASHVAAMVVASPQAVPDYDAENPSLW